MMKEITNTRRIPLSDLVKSHIESFRKWQGYNGIVHVVTAIVIDNLPPNAKLCRSLSAQVGKIYTFTDKSCPICYVATAAWEPMPGDWDDV